MSLQDFPLTKRYELPFPASCALTSRDWLFDIETRREFWVNLDADEEYDELYPPPEPPSPPDPQNIDGCWYFLWNGIPEWHSWYTDRAALLLSQIPDSVLQDLLITTVFLADDLKHVTFGVHPQPNPRGDQFMVSPGFISNHAPLRDYEPLPDHIQTIRRSELAVIERLNATVDVVEYTCPVTLATRKAAAKVHHFERCQWSLLEAWQEIRIHLGLGRSRNRFLVTATHLITEQLRGETVVVGFLTPYVDGSCTAFATRRFKLKWLRQLLDVVDHLHLHCGVALMDWKRDHVLVDLASDEIRIIDFGIAAQLRDEPPTHMPTPFHPPTPDLEKVRGDCRWGTASKDEMAEKRHVLPTSELKRVAALVWEMLCHPWRFLVEKESVLKKPDREVLNNFLCDATKWVKHDEVHLDTDIGDFFRVLMEWLHRRRFDPAVANIRHFSQAAQPVLWTASPKTVVPYFQDVPKRAVLRHAEFNLWPDFDLEGRYAAEIQLLEKFGIPYIEWHRLSEKQTDPKRWLLLTGKYADEEEGKKRRGGRGGAREATTAALRRSPRLIRRARLLAAQRANKQRVPVDMTTKPSIRWNMDDGVPPHREMLDQAEEKLRRLVRERAQGIGLPLRPQHAEWRAGLVDTDYDE
ncbi:hypothetical protein QBC35DRAFT_478893 [Podospora australis]|uniref:Protein kinase domain-containing protein n=1 Tax=Podospora australis TaxID=1536484 RepID=A0AAN6WIC2_9PEZI|nr:hypothetical protein QBC35DRAFT_478893 [Podospora australis]